MKMALKVQIGPVEKLSPSKGIERKALAHKADKILGPKKPCQIIQVARLAEFSHHLCHGGKI